MPGVPVNQVRKIAISLPQTVELDHHGIPSFRIHGKIFATLWDLTHLNVMLPPLRILEVVKENPKFCSAFWWGRQIRCIQIDISKANRTFVKALLNEAWVYKKTKRP